MKTRAELLKDLEGLEARLADQARLMDGTRSEIQEVRTQLATIAEPREVKGPLEPEGKVALFMRLFRGREDVFPRLWVSKRKDKKGYSPVCANERNPLLCDKFKVKCAECPNRRFVCLDDRVVLGHLQGRHVIGVYPMLLDETCWFLAADFDGEGWQEDAKAVMSTCAELGVPATLERSRSGQGAHVWIFFSAPVHAATARKLGCFLLTTTMNRRYQLSMASYDSATTITPVHRIASPKNSTEGPHLFSDFT